MVISSSGTQSCDTSNSCPILIFTLVRVFLSLDLVVVIVLYDSKQLFSFPTIEYLSMLLVSLIEQQIHDRLEGPVQLRSLKCTYIS